MNLPNLILVSGSERNRRLMWTGLTSYGFAPDSFVIADSLFSASAFLDPEKGQLLIIAAISTADELQLEGFVAESLEKNHGLTVLSYRPEPLHVPGVRNVSPGNYNLANAIWTSKPAELTLAA